MLLDPYNTWTVELSRIYRFLSGKLDKRILGLNPLFLFPVEHGLSVAQCDVATSAAVTSVTSKTNLAMLNCICSHGRIKPMIQWYKTEYLTFRPEIIYPTSVFGDVNLKPVGLDYFQNLNFISSSLDGSRNVLTEKLNQATTCTRKRRWCSFCDPPQLYGGGVKRLK